MCLGQPFQSKASKTLANLSHYQKAAAPSRCEIVRPQLISARAQEINEHFRLSIPDKISKQKW